MSMLYSAAVFGVLRSPYAILLLTTLFIIYLVLRWKSDYWVRRNVIGPKSYPLIGTFWEHLFLPNNLLEEKRYRKYGPIYGTMQGWVPVLTVGDPDLIKKILVTDFRCFFNHRQLLSPETVFGKNLTDLKDDEWKRVRRIISPVFATGKLKAMEPLVKKCVNNTLQYVEDVANERRDVDLKKLMMSYTMDTICLCAFAMETNGYKDPNNEFIAKANDLITLRLWRIICTSILPSKLITLFNLDLFDQSLVDYFQSVLQNAINERKLTKLNKNDFVKLLMDAELSKDEIDLPATKLKRILTDDEIMAQCLLFFVVGYETTSTLLMFTLYALAMNPKVQQKLFDEIRSCYNHDDDLDYESLMSLPFVDAVINESLRMYTPIPLFEHVCNENYELGDTGIIIEKDTIVNIPYYAMHHDETLFPEPYEFIPERFLPENKDQIKPYSFLPFGAGPRICLGMRFSTFSAKMFLASLINRFEVIRTESTATTPEYDSTFIYLGCKPLLVSFKKRELTL